jgi:hypothetical protein
MFDRRGSGSSDNPSGETLPSWERWTDDARAVLDAVTSEQSVRGTDIAGIGVHIATRVLDAAAAGELLVSAAVPMLVAGSGFEFEDRGERELKGVPEPGTSSPSNLDGMACQRGRSPTPGPPRPPGSTVGTWSISRCRRI